MPRLVTASLIVLAAAAGPALAQPAATPARPPAGTTAPAPTPPPAPAGPPATATPPTTTNPPVVTVAPPEAPPPEVPPEANRPAPQQVTLPAREPPADNVSFDDPPMENYFHADNDRDGGGFPWGLLGLLGLLGLIPWLRGGPKTIYVERERQKQDDERP